MKIKTKNTIQVAAFLVLSTLLCMSTYAQKKEAFAKKIYLQLGGGQSSQDGSFSELGLQAVLKNNWVATLSYHNLKMDPKNVPDNYIPGYSILFFFSFPDRNPDTQMSLFNLTGGKCFETGRRTWFTTEAGLSIVNGEKLIFTPQPVEHDVLYVSSNYSIKKETKTTIGGLVKADFNWAILPYVGLGTGVFANFNSIQSPVGFEVKLTCGWMNLKPKQKKIKTRRAEQ